MNRIKKMLVKWLEIEKPMSSSKIENIVNDKFKELEESATKKLQSDLKATVQTLKAFGEISCTNCNKKILTYPFGGGYYRSFDGAVLCSNKCVDENKEKNNA